MKILKFIILGLLILIAAVFVIGLFLPSKVKVSQTKVIQAEQELVFSLVNDLKRWYLWSPWFEKDPATLVKFSERTIGEGASYSWESKHRDVGNGSMVITKSIPNEILSSKINFGQDNNAMVDFLIEKAESGTKVTWSFYVDFGSNILARYFGLIMKGPITNDYQRGLYKLDSLAAVLKNNALDGRLGSVGEVQLGATIAVLIKDSCIADHVARRYALHDIALRKAINDAGLEVNGRPFAIWYSWSNENCVFEIGIPVAKPFEVKPPVTTRKIGGTKALRIEYFGPYKLIGLAHEAADMWLDSTQRAAAGPPLELYMSDPNNTPEADIQTDVYYPLD